jgi:hypothetical protein
MIDIVFKMKLMDKEFELTKEEARKLYVDLKSIFEEFYPQNVPVPIYVPYNPFEWWQKQPIVTC